MKAYITRTAAIILKNQSIGDGVLIREISSALREFAELLQNGTANHCVLNFVSSGGTKVTILGGAYDKEGIPP